MYKIEKNIPIPNLTGVCVYPWTEMVVGDCFLVECDLKDFKEVRRVRGRLYTSSHRWLKTRDFDDKLKITLRKDDKGIRVWLVSK